MWSSLSTWCMLFVGMCVCSLGGYLFVWFEELRKKKFMCSVCMHSFLPVNLWSSLCLLPLCVCCVFLKVGGDVNM